MIKVILASKSPRRRELLARIIQDFEIIVADTDETLGEGVSPFDGVRILAERKGAAVLPKVTEDSIIISSDTLVELDGVPLGKPTDREDARRMLRSLSGRRHNVHTGVAVHYMGRCYSETETSGVIFREMTDGEILEYIATGEPMDKAGAYGIQGIGGKFVTQYDGNFDTIMGLPVGLTARLINTAVGKEIVKYDEKG